MEIIIVIISFIFLNKCLISIIHKTENKLEKSLYVVMLVITDMFLVIYYFDRFNVATTLKMNENVDTQNWLNNISNVFANIVSASIGGIIAYGIASSEIKENNRQNIDNNRIQNMPMLKYNIKTREEDKTKYIVNEKNLIHTKYDGIENKHNYDIFIEFKNIGLNNIKKIIVDMECQDFCAKHRIFGEKSQIPVEIGETIQIYKYFNLLENKKYNMILKVYYEDVLQNWYLQEVNIQYITTNVMEGITSTFEANVEVNVIEEKIINKE